MFRLSGVFFLVVAVACGSLLFLTSQSVQRAEQKLSKIKQSNEAEIETLRVLSAEWDYLNRPERLEQLTLGNLDMEDALVQDDSFVDASEEIPQPIKPVIPKIKPIYVGGGLRKEVAKTQEPIIQNKERESFDRLINSVSGDGGTP